MTEKSMNLLPGFNKCYHFVIASDCVLNNNLQLHQAFYLSPDPGFDI